MWRARYALPPYATGSEWWMGTARCREAAMCLPTVSLAVGTLRRACTQHHGRTCSGHPRLCLEEDVDARDKRGHDEGIQCASARSEPHQLDRVEILHAAADPLGRVEQHVRLGGERIAQHTHALAIDDEIAALEIAERDRKRVRRDIRHVLGLDD